MRVGSRGTEYRLHDGQVQMNNQGTWIPSAHDDATVDEVLGGDYDDHALLPLLREKFGLQAS